MKRVLLLLFVAPPLLLACDHELPRTKFILPHGYVGEMSIYYDKPNGQKEIDKGGWVINRISEKGECFSAFPYKAGWTIPHKTWKFYEIYSKDSITEIDEFDEKEYFEDPTRNANRKYVFFISSGFENKGGNNPNWFLRYYIDSAKNYKEY